MKNGVFFWLDKVYSRGFSKRLRFWVWGFWDSWVGGPRRRCNSKSLSLFRISRCAVLCLRNPNGGITWGCNTICNENITQLIWKTSKRVTVLKNQQGQRFSVGSVTHSSHKYNTYRAIFRISSKELRSGHGNIRKQEEGVFRRGFLQNVRLSGLWRSEKQMYYWDQCDTGLCRNPLC